VYYKGFVNDGLLLKTVRNCGVFGTRYESFPDHKTQSQSCFTAIMLQVMKMLFTCQYSECNMPFQTTTLERDVGNM